MVSKERCIKFKENVDDIGLAQSILLWNIKPSSAERMLRRANEEELDPPKILLFDIETLPLKGYFWRLGEQRVNMQQIIDDFCILSWSAKWLNDNEMFTGLLSPKEAKERNDKRILQDIWELLEEADITIGHNSKKFDHRMLNARFIYHDIKPPTPYQMIDTLKQSRKIAAFSSHKLDYLGKFLKQKGKIETDFDLWKACDKGEQNALSEMLEYNIGDVYLLEEIYYELRPWMKGHPNLAVYVEADKNICPTCLSTNLDWKGNYTTSVGKYASFRCLKCGAIGRSRFTALNKEVREQLLSPTAR